MGIASSDIFLIAPELAIVVLATAVVLADLLFRRKRWPLVIAVAGLALPLIASLMLWNEVHVNGAQMGFNDSLIVDKFALYFKFLVIGTAALVLVAGAGYAERFHPYQAEFTGLVLFSASGLMLLPASADLITLYLSLELATLPVVALAAFTKTQTQSVEAAVKYLVLSAVSSAILIYGFAFLYGASGTMQIISDTQPTITQSLTSGDSALPFGGFAVMVGAVLATAGFGFKLSMVPFQMWTPDVYEGAPTPVGAFLAVASKAAAFAIVLRFFYATLGDVSPDWSMMFAALAALTMTIGNVVAIVQTNVKRLLGYSTIAHAGYMLIGVAAIAANSQETGDGTLGITSVLFYLAGYAAMTLAAFFAVIVLTQRTGDERIAALAGAGKRSPLAAAALALALLSLTGIPPTVGFMGKLFLFNAAVNTGLVWLAVIAVVNSVVSAYYYIGIIRTMYLRDPSDDSTDAADLPNRATLAITSAAVLILGRLARRPAGGCPHRRHRYPFLAPYAALRRVECIAQPRYCLTRVVGLRYRRDDAYAIGACPRYLPRVLLRDAAYRQQRRAAGRDNLPHCAQRLQTRRTCVRLRIRGEYAPDRDVIRSRLAGSLRLCDQRVRRPRDLPRPQHLPRSRERQVVLAHVDAIRRRRNRYIRVIVDDEHRACADTQPAQLSGELQPVALVTILHAQLNRRCTPAERLLRDPSRITIERERRVNDDVYPPQTLSLTTAVAGACGHFRPSHRLCEICEVRTALRVFVQCAARQRERPERSKQRHVPNLEAAGPFEASRILGAAIQRSDGLLRQHVQSQTARRIEPRLRPLVAGLS